MVCKYSYTAINGVLSKTLLHHEHFVPSPGRGDCVLATLGVFFTCHSGAMSARTSADGSNASTRDQWGSSSAAKKVARLAWRSSRRAVMRR